MDDKELEKDAVDKDFPENSENDAQNEEQNKSEAGEWKFDAKAPTLESEIELDGEFTVDIPEAANEKNTESEAEAEAEQEPQEKKPFKVNKKVLAIVLSSIAAVIIAAIVIVVCVFEFTVPNTNEKMNRGNIAMTVGSTDVSIGMYNYYYTGTVESYLQEAQYGYNNIDPNLDYAEQFTTDEDGNEISWLEVFKKDTIDHIQYVLAYFEAAVEHNVEITDAQKNQIDEYIKGIGETASEKGLSIDAYIQEQYGEHCGEATLRKILRQSSIASNYRQELFANNKIDENELNKYFESNKSVYLSSKFSCIEILGDGTDEAAIAKLEEKVKSYQSKVTDKKSLTSLIPTASAELIKQYLAYGYFESEKEAIEKLTEVSEITLTYKELEHEFDKETADWLISDKIANGSTNYFVNKDYGVAYLFLKTDKPFYSKDEIYSVRHILVMPESAKEGAKEFTDAEWNAALKQANSILDEYNAGDKTEYSFALLAETKSDDVQSTSAGQSGFFGGAIEGVHLGEMVPEFEKWAVDKSRKYGDVEIVKSQFGYHIMYFIFDGPEYLFNAQTDFKDENLMNYEKEIAKKYAVEEKSGMSKTKVAEPVKPKSEENSEK